MARIISMCTYSYRDWVHTFYHSIKRFNPDVNMTIYLVNFPEEKAHLVRSYFPGVEFVEHNGSFPLKETFNPNKDAYKVTFLKGEFMRRSLEYHKEHCLWIDITAFVRTDLSDVFEALDNRDVAVIQREPGVTKGNKAYAAEIFGFSEKAPHVWKAYERFCNARKDLWYADQLSLCDLPTNNKHLLPFGPFCNFFYEKDARTWSDRGKEGKGKIEADDKKYTLDKFIADMNRGYRLQFANYTKSFDKQKPKILVFIDDTKWCYLTTAQEVVKRLARYYDFQIARTVELDRDKIKRWNGDLIWARCGAYRAVKVLAVKPAYSDRIITSITTGDRNAQPVIERHKRLANDHIGVFTQNQLTLDLLKENDVKTPAFLIPNGVDVDRFKPVDREDDRPFTIGFAGRHSDSHADNAKGFSQYYIAAVDSTPEAVKRISIASSIIYHMTKCMSFITV